MTDTAVERPKSCSTTGMPSPPCPRVRLRYMNVPDRGRRELGNVGNLADLTGVHGQVSRRRHYVVSPYLPNDSHRGTP